MPSTDNSAAFDLTSLAKSLESSGIQVIACEVNTLDRDCRSKACLSGMG